MAIVTLAEVKTFLQITGTEYDALITALIPQVEGDYLTIRGIPFFTFTGDTTNGSAIIEDVSDFNNIALNLIIESEDYTIREKVIGIDEDEYEITLENSLSADNDDLQFTIYPQGSQYHMSKMIGYNLSKSNGNGVKSETIGTYDYTKFDSITGYPVDIIGSIVKYHRYHV